MFRQRPGANNALGHVKFLFPNDFDVYLHDTRLTRCSAAVAARSVTAACASKNRRRSRVTSCGTTRSGTPIASWRPCTPGEERQVKLRRTIPVHIAHFTAWVDEQGGLHFQPDVYGYDAKQRADAPARAASDRRVARR